MFTYQSLSEKMTLLRLLLAVICLPISCSAKQERQVSVPIQSALSSSIKPKEKSMEIVEKLDTATLGAGCFWCVEAMYQRLEGVMAVKSGYSGGTLKNPSYKEVCTGETGHDEVCQIVFDPNVIPFQEILNVFFSIHDPTTLNRQGNDVGTQYRSAIFFHTETQKSITEEYIKRLNSAKTFTDSIVTEVTAFEKFYPAEDYHDNYFNQNGEQSYCQFVVRPKVEKFEKLFRGKLKN